MEQPIGEILPGLELGFLIDLLLGFLITSIRLSAFIIAALFFSAVFLMVRVRILIAFVISIIVFSTQPQAIDTKILTSAYGIIIIVKEIAIGATRTAFIYYVCCSLISGRKIATSVDWLCSPSRPHVSGVQTPVVSQMLHLFLIMIFLTFDGHLLALKILIESYQIIPIGNSPEPSALVDSGMAASGSMFLNATIIMLPVVIIILLINVSIGIILGQRPN